MDVAEEAGDILSPVDYNIADVANVDDVNTR